MKNKILLILTGCLAVLLSSCLGDSEFDGLNVVDKNCQIKTFSLKSDSVLGLKSVRFTIDQLNGNIMNLDSMPYGTEINKVICDLTYGSYVAKLEVMPEATGDTVAWSLEDSLNFSKPVKFVLSSYDGLTKRIYKAWVNVHKQNPDSMVWNCLSNQVLPANPVNQKTILFDNGQEKQYFMFAETASGYKLYNSAETDAANWKELSLTGFPEKNVDLANITDFENILYVSTAEGSLYSSLNGIDWKLVESTQKVKLLLGALGKGANQEPCLSTIVEDKDGLKFAAMSKSGEWQIGSAVPADFPMEGFSSSSLSLMYKSRILLVGGKSASGQLQNASWATMDALKWVNQTISNKEYFGKRQGATLAYYDDMFYLIGGIDENGTPLKDIYVSSDYGLTWKATDFLIALPVECQARAFASVLVDKDNFLMIVGGKKAVGESDLNDVWKGRINRLGFIRQNK